MGDTTLSDLRGKQVAEYVYNYWYLATKIRHIIREYYNETTGVRMVELEKETRKDDFYVILPHSLWVTKDGYPPLVTDGSFMNKRGDSTNYFAAIPTVQSDEHIRLFDDSLKAGLGELNLSYDALSKRIKEGAFIKEFPMTGFAFKQEGKPDRDILKELEKRVVTAYGKVLQSAPQRCPIDLFINQIVRKGAIAEFHFFKNDGFDVPLNGHRAFFTMLMDFRVPPETEKV